MIRNTDRYRINAVAHLFEHFSVIVVLFGFGKTHRRLVQMFIINVTDCHHVAVFGSVVGIAVPLTLNTDAGKVNCFNGGFAFLSADAAFRRD